MVNGENIILAELMEAYGNDWEAFLDWLAFEADMETNPWG